jgi:uncharacterized damage-inducible protein DinB
MTRALRLAKHIQRTVKGPMWHGAALGPLLEGTDEAQANARPIAGAHSIWEIVLHVAAWAEIARARLAGERTGDPSPDEDWPPVGAGGDWPRAMERLAGSHNALAGDVRPLTDEALEANVRNLSYSVEVLLQGVVEHSTYHGGQIALLQKALGVRR